jgi:hypothetical protein
MGYDLSPSGLEAPHRRPSLVVARRFPTAYAVGYVLSPGLRGTPPASELAARHKSTKNYTTLRDCGLYCGHMRNGYLLTLVLAFGLLTSCNKQETPATSSADLPRGTVVLRDGTRVSGIIAQSSASEITINSEGGGSRTIPMRDVRRVDYGEAPVPPSSAPSSQAQQPPPTSQAQQPPPPMDTHEDHYHPRREEVRSVTHVLPAGTEIPVRNEETIDSARAVEGQLYAAEMARDVRDADGAVVIPRGANVQIVIKSAARGGRFHGTSDLVLDLQSVSIEGQQYRLDTSDLEDRGHKGLGANKRTGEFLGGGAAVGAIIGAIAGGGKGAAIGGGAGAGAGALTEVLTKGGSIRVPAETILTFRLDRPLRVVEAR